MSLFGVVEDGELDELDDVDPDDGLVLDVPDGGVDVEGEVLDDELGLDDVLPVPAPEVDDDVDPLVDGGVAEEDEDDDGDGVTVGGVVLLVFDSR